MGLKKGMTNNPAGRPKGTGNKITQKVKGLIADIFENNFGNIQKDIEALTDPKDRLKFFLDLLPYVVAKKAPETEDGETPTLKLDIAPGVDLGKLLGDKKEEE